jgi:hypothetical protein
MSINLSEFLVLSTKIGRTDVFDGSSTPPLAMVGLDHFIFFGFFSLNSSFCGGTGGTGGTSSKNN